MIFEPAFQKRIKSIIVGQEFCKVYFIAELWPT